MCVVERALGRAEEMDPGREHRAGVAHGVAPAHEHAAHRGREVRAQPLRVVDYQEH